MTLASARVSVTSSTLPSTRLLPPSRACPAPLLAAVPSAPTSRLPVIPAAAAVAVVADAVVSEVDAVVDAVDLASAVAAAVAEVIVAVAVAVEEAAVEAVVALTTVVALETSRARRCPLIKQAIVGSFGNSLVF